MFKLAEELKRILTKRYEEEYHSWQELDKKKVIILIIIKQYLSICW
jgi:hypothetical protein